VVADWVMIAIEKRIDLGFESAGPAMITGNPFRCASWPRT
jgi:two-component system sensor histidine kinase TctE